MVHVEINILNENDNRPLFTQPLYTAIAKEDVGLGEVILRVRAFDKDENPSFTNDNISSNLTYSVSDPNFAIDEQGAITAIRRLDADQNRDRFYIYRFNASVTDGIFEDTATVRINRSK
jgi:hypothetical protein